MIAANELITQPNQPSIDLLSEPPIDPRFSWPQGSTEDVGDGHRNRIAARLDLDGALGRDTTGLVASVRPRVGRRRGVGNLDERKASDRNDADGSAQEGTT
jgi:hypothetical protein